MKPGAGRFLAVVVGALTAATSMHPAEETVTTAVYARVGHGYKREKARDGSFKPEHYALSNGGRIEGTTTDITVDRVTYPEVAEVAMRLLAQQNYHYAQTQEQARLLLVLQWGNTIAPNGTDYNLSVGQAASVYAELTSIRGPQGPGGQGTSSFGGAGTNADGSAMGAGDPSIPARFESAIHKLLMDNRVRDQLNEKNARVVGFLDDLAETNDIRRWAGGGDRFADLLADLEESRYYIVISAYDFPELVKNNNRKLLWQARVSVRSAGNSFNDSFVPMMKSASKYFGRDSGKLIRSEESKGTVELGDLKFIGEAKEPDQSAPKVKK